MRSKTWGGGEINPGVAALTLLVGMLKLCDAHFPALPWQAMSCRYQQFSVKPRQNELRSHRLYTAKNYERGERTQKRKTENII